MRILIISKNGDGLGIAYKLTLEGHHVDMYIKDPICKYDLKGIIGRPSEWRPLVSKSDLIVCDMVGFSQYEELFQKMGKPYICCNKVADVLELDRIKGLETFKRVGISQPEYWTYKNTAECESKLDEIWKDQGMVVKPSGNIDTGKTYLAKDKELFRWCLSTIPDGIPLVVQCLIPEEDSVEVSTEGWFNGVSFLHPFNHTFEEKRFMPGNVGKMTGCMGNVVKTIPKADRLVKETLLKLEPILKKIGYRGPFDVNCIVTKAKVYGLEMTARFGYDAIEALMQGLREPMASLLFDTAIGAKKEMDITPDYLIAVRVTRDPYPVMSADKLEPKERDRGMPVVGFNAKDMPHVYFCDVFLDGETLRYGASDGVLLKCTAFGKTVEMAQERVYRTAKNLKSIDHAYRIDIGDRVPVDMQKLKNWGWLE
jgi:phosphoribosylamine---glycine ligase